MDQLIGLSEHLRAWPRWQQLAGATALTLTALLGHVWLVDHLQSYQFLFFFPAVCLSALLFGEESGIWSVALSAALAAFLLFEPEGFAVSDADEALALVLFIAVGLFLCWTIGAMRRHLGALSFDLHEARAKTSQLQQAVKEDELLLREMAHRMKNDLQAIASMLDVQGRAIAPEQGGDALQAASARVRIMGRVQERLLAGGGSQGSLEVGSLIESLCSDLQASLAGLRPVSLKVEAEKVNLPVKDAVAAALIVNELVTNALKHAFPDERAGTVLVRLAPDGNHIVLAIADDGAGAPVSKGQISSRSRGLGQKLVRALSQQLGGTMEATSGEVGTHCTLRFPAPSSDGAHSRCGGA
jgi:two-component system, sensor histidine kinase PdtaS